MKLNSKLYYVTIIFLFAAAQKTSALTFEFKPPVAETDVENIMTNLLKWVLTVAGSIALVALIIAGITYMTSMGSPEKAKKAKKSIYWTLGGLVLILLSYSILVILDSIFTS